MAGLPSVAAANEMVSAAAAMPPSIQVETLLRSVTTKMLEKSPTFKRQCHVIGASETIVVKVRVVPASRNTSTRATTTFRRYTSGLTIADVEIPAASPLVELLAHEFEHIAEYVEGVNLKALVRDRPEEAYQMRDGSFETSRAVDAGRAVVKEMGLPPWD
jgi:hypothetical protein